MSEEIASLYSQIQQLHLQRQKNTFEQQNLKQQIALLLTDNQVLHEQLNTIINSDSNRISIDDKQRNITDSIKGEVKPYKYEYEARRTQKESQKQQNNQLDKLQSQDKDQQIKKLKILVQSLEKKLDQNFRQQQHKKQVIKLQQQIQQLRNQNEKLCEVNDKVISNFTDLRQSFQQFQQRKQSKQSIKELEVQIQYLTTELQNVININNELNQKINNNRRASGLNDNDEVKKLKHLLEEKEKLFQQKELEWKQQYHDLNSQIEELKRKNNKKHNNINIQSNNNIKFQDYESRSCEENNSIPYSLPPRPQKFTKHQQLQQSKQQSRSQVQTLVQLTTRLEDQLKTSQHIHEHLLNNIKQNTARVQSQYVRNIHPYSNYLQVDDQSFYRWISLQDRIKYLRDENERLRSYATVQYY